jgi:type VI secretion system secreted protein Hcp
MKRPPLLLALLLLAGPLPGGQYYLKLDNIKGEVTTAPFKDEIAVSSLQLGVARPASSPGSGTQTPPPSFSDLTVTKLLDRASPLLLLACAQGTNIPSATLTAVEPAGATNRIYYQIVLSNVLVTSVSQSGGGDRPTESVSLNYTHILWKYFPSNPPPITTGWNLITQTPLP